MSSSFTVENAQSLVACGVSGSPGDESWGWGQDSDSSVTLLSIVSLYNTVNAVLNRIISSSFFSLFSIPDIIFKDLEKSFVAICLL